mgnify:CR=1 FL=1
MITRVDSVMIGKKCPASYTTVDALNAGEVALFDENRALIEDQDGALKASTIYVGVCTGDMTVTMPDGTSSTKKVVEYSNAIQKASKPSYVMGDYKAPVVEKIEIDLTSAKPVIGHRYVLRIVYKDLYEAPGQFTHTYETVATSGVADDLGNALLKKINKHANRRVTATFASHKLTLTAMPKDDNEGVYSLNEYSVVSMEASLYVTIPGALLSNVPEAVAGATIKLLVTQVKVSGNKYVIWKYVCWVTKVTCLQMHIPLSNLNVLLLKELLTITLLLKMIICI